MFYQLIENSLKRNPITCPKLEPVMSTFLPKLKRFEESAGEDYLNAFVRVEVQKGELLFREGEVSRQIWLLKEGIARTFSYIDEKEITCEFYFSAEMIELFTSSSLQTPSQYSIQALTDVVAYSISWAKINQFKSQYPIINELEKIMLACHSRYQDNRIVELQSLTATERYMLLRERYGIRIESIQLTHIASYLGIALERLSRIRRKLSQEDAPGHPLPAKAGRRSVKPEKP